MITPIQKLGSVSALIHRRPTLWILALSAMAAANLSTRALAVPTDPPTSSETSKTADSSGLSGQWLHPRGNGESTGQSDRTLPDDLVVRWEYQADEAIETSPVVGQGRVFVADVMGQIYAIDQKEGKELWRRNYDTGFLAAPAIHGDGVYIGDIDGNLYALDAASGDERWTQTIDGEVYGAVGFHGDNLLVTSQVGKLYCFNRGDGSPQWTYQIEDQIRCSPTVAGDRTFLGGCDGQLHMVDLKTGKSIGDPLPLGGPTGSTPAVRGSQAFLPIMDGVVLAFDWKKPAELWAYEDEERRQEYSNSAAVSADVVVVSSQYKQVDAISIESGKRIWRHTLRRRADASPVIAGQDVWIAASDGRLIRLSLTDGAEKWVYEIRGSFLGGPAIASHELYGDELYIADDKGVVRCFSAKQ